MDQLTAKDEAINPRLVLCRCTVEEIDIEFFFFYLYWLLLMQEKNFKKLIYCWFELSREEVSLSTARLVNFYGTDTVRTAASSDYDVMMAPRWAFMTDK